MAGEDNLIEAGQEFELSALKGEVEKLKNEVTKYKILLNEVDSDASPDVVSDEEAICVEQIHLLKVKSRDRELNTDEVKRLDLLHKNLKLARGELSRINNKSAVNKLSKDELAKIAKGE